LPNLKRNSAQKFFDLVEYSIFCALLKYGKSNEKWGCFGSRPNSWGHGSTHYCDVTRRHIKTWHLSLSHLFYRESRGRTLRKLPVMPSRCVAAGFGNVKNLKEGISLHQIPYFGGRAKKEKMGSFHKAEMRQVGTICHFCVMLKAF